MNTSVTTVKQSVSFRWNSDLVKSLKEMASDRTEVSVISLKLFCSVL